MASTFNRSVKRAHAITMDAGSTRGDFGPALGLVLAAAASLVLWAGVLEAAHWVARSVL